MEGLMVCHYEDKQKASSTASIPTARRTFGSPTFALQIEVAKGFGALPFRSWCSTHTTISGARLRQSPDFRGLLTAKE